MAGSLVRNGRRADDGFAEIAFADDFALRLGGVHDLRQALFIDAIKKLSGPDQRGAERTFEPELPQAVAGGGGAARKHAGVIQGKDFPAERGRTGRAGLELIGAPKRLG